MHVQNPEPGAGALQERIFFTPRRGRWMFWWSWAEPVAELPADAAAIIARTSGRPGDRVTGQVALTDPLQPRFTLSDAEDLRLTREEFPDWGIFPDLHYIWHGWLRDADPPLKVRAEELHILRHQIALAIRHRQRQAARRLSSGA